MFLIQETIFNNKKIIFYTKKYQQPIKGKNNEIEEECQHRRIIIHQQQQHPCRRTFFISNHFCTCSFPFVITSCLHGWQMQQRHIWWSLCLHVCARLLLHHAKGQTPNVTNAEQNRDWGRWEWDDEIEEEEKNCWGGWDWA